MSSVLETERLLLQCFTPDDNPENADSIRVLQGLGMTFERLMRLNDGAPEVAVYRLERG